MKIYLIIFGLLAWIGSCSEETEIPERAIFEADAVWINQLAADGCAWHFSVKSADSTVSFVPDDSSVKKIEDVVGKPEGAYSFIDVHIKYSLTANKKLVQCGWGRNASYDEINVHAISKR